MKLYLLKPSLNVKFRKPAAALVMAAAFFLCTFTSFGQLIHWSAAGYNATFGPTVWPTASISADLDLTTPFTRGSSISASGTAANTAYGGSGGWNSAGTDANGFIFAFTPATGKTVSLTTLTANLRKSNTGPSSCKVQYSIDGGAYVDLAPMTSLATSGGNGNLNTVQLGSASDLQNIEAGTVVKFRFLPQGTTGNFYFMNDGVSLNGTSGLSAPLAIVLGQLTAVNEGAANRLNWNSLTEEKGDRFAIERSADGITFRQIALLDANGVASQYTYEDAAALNGVNYYRLYLLNNDGTRIYSKIVSATVTVNTTAAAAVAYPNPVKDRVTVAIPGAMAGGKVTLADAMGKILASETIAATVSFDMSQLPAGFYLVRVEQGSSVQSIRVAKR